MKAYQLQNSDRFVLKSQVAEVIAAKGDVCLIIYQVFGNPEQGASRISVRLSAGRIGTISADSEVIICDV